MNSTNFQAINKSVPLKEKSSFRAPNGLTKLDNKRSVAFTDDSDGKYCVNCSKIPRRQMPASLWFKETLKSHQPKGKIKKPPSMILRSKSNSQNEIDKFKHELFSKVEFPKTELSESSELSESLESQELDEYFEENEKENLDLEELLDENYYSTLKPSNTIKEEEIDMTYKDARESLSNCNIRSSKPEAKKEREIIQKNVREAERHDRIIHNLYESVKCLVGPLFNKIKWTSSEKNNVTEIIQVHSTTTQVIEGTENAVESVPDFSTIQGHYEITLREISNIWKNAISLIGSVKDHTLKFVEENDKTFDREQLTLEAEMLQLAIDFAISYSKLKTDFLIKSAKKNLGLKNLEKSELENFMDSKTFSGLYNNDDLAAMARTVQDLNASVLKGEDFELD